MVTALPTWICAKSVLQIYSHGITLPVWISTAPKNPSSPQAICQGQRSCCCHQGGLTWKSAKWHFGNISLLSLLRGGPSMWWSTERLPWADPNTKIPGLTWHSLFLAFSTAQCFFLLRKVYKTFSQCHLVFFTQVTRPTCSQQLSQSLPELSRLEHTNIIACISQRLWYLPWCCRTLSVQPQQHSQDLRTWKGIGLGVCSLSSKPLKTLKGKFLPPHSLSL